MRRDFRLRYHGSSLGVLWVLMSPLAQLVVLVFLFQKVVPLSIEAYPAFVFSALLPWAWFSSCVSDAGNLFLSNRDLVRHPHFSPATLVVVSAASRLLLYLVSLPLLLAVLFAYGRPLNGAVLVLPVLLVIQGTLIVGVGLVVATLNVFYRDVQHIAGVLVSLLFYLTPIFYRSQQATEPFTLIFKVNPLALLVESYRAIFFHGTPPTAAVLGTTAATSMVVVVLGYLVYRRQQREIAETI